ncbi:MAG: acylneuraminate cytidylyltransferase family protein [Bdellovibrionales bacterium]|nr:acylneuraminate cytidylyltransferase family protein [Bdellovibrionales bacterium]
MDSALKSKSILCTICARGGSKGVPGKNIRSLLGKPLIAHTIEQAKAAGVFKYVAVSSESHEILKVAKEYGADILIERPHELATDTAAKLPVIRHALIESEKQTGDKFNIHVDLDVTSPLRLPSDIIDSVKLLVADDNVTNVITGTPSRRSPYFNLVEQSADGFVNLAKAPAVPFVRRQDAPKTFDMNASIYVWWREGILSCETLFSDRTAIYVMPEDRSIDIDSELDWKVVEMLLTERQKG